jgi:hypothetical protein
MEGLVLFRATAIAIALSFAWSAAGQERAGPVSPATDEPVIIDGDAQSAEVMDRRVAPIELDWIESVLRDPTQIDRLRLSELTGSCTRPASAKASRRCKPTASMPTACGGVRVAPTSPKTQRSWKAALPFFRECAPGCTSAPPCGSWPGMVGRPPSIPVGLVTTSGLRTE